MNILAPPCSFPRFYENTLIFFPKSHLMHRCVKITMQSRSQTYPHQPAEHKLNPVRLLTWFFIGMPAIREVYQFIDTSPVEKTRRLGHNAWLAVCNMTLEILVIIKFGANEFGCVPCAII